MSTGLKYGAITLASLVFVLAIGTVFFVLSASKATELEEEIQQDLEAIRTGSPDKTQVLNQYSIICFDAHVAGAIREFGEEARRFGAQLAKSLDACGIDATCCKLSSDTAGIIGLVKGDEVRCVKVNGFGFYTNTQRAICAPPRGLRLEKSPLPVGRSVPGRSYVVTSDFPIYQVLE